mmetsp:Transcript_8358/g.26602  ORF Transcript_8358/g.26602 Transcript_8358/m.26602 type:complete len:315 (-) Transcript_8358:840-1784(-)
MPYSSVSGLWPPVSSWTHPGDVLADSMSKLRVFSSSLGLTTPNSLSTTRAPGLIFRRTFLRRPSSAEETRSVLLRTKTLANSAWSTSRSTMVRSSPFSAPNSRLSTAFSPLSQSRRKCLQSMTVTSVSRRAMPPNSGRPPSSFAAKVVATGIGSEIPVLSMIKCSKRRSTASARTLSIRSSRSVQQMQPLWSSTTLSLLSSSCTPSCSSFESMLIDAMSLTSTATRMPSRLFSKCVSRVVLPAPRKPLSRVTGSLSEPSSSPAPRPTGSVVGSSPVIASSLNAAMRSAFTSAETRSTVINKRLLQAPPQAPPAV